MLTFENMKDLVYIKEKDENTGAIVYLNNNVEITAHSNVLLKTGLFAKRDKQEEELYIQASGDDDNHYIIRAELEENTNQVIIYIYNITDKNIVVEKDAELSYLYLAINALSQNLHYENTLDKSKDLNAYTVYTDDEIIVKQIKPNTIGNTKYTIYPDGKRSFTIFFNKG